MNVGDIEMVLYLTTSTSGKATLRSFPPIWGDTHVLMNRHDARIGLRVRWQEPSEKKGDDRRRFFFALKELPLIFKLQEEGDIKNKHTAKRRN